MRPVTTKERLNSQSDASADGREERVWKISTNQRARPCQPPINTKEEEEEEEELVPPH